MSQDVLEHQDALRKPGKNVNDASYIASKKNPNTYDAASEAARHQGKADEQEQARAPHGARRAIGVHGVPWPHAVLIDQAHDEHPEERADARHPVDEGNVHGRGTAP